MNKFKNYYKIFDLNAIVNANFHESFHNCHVSTIFSFYNFNNFKIIKMSICFIVYKSNYFYVKYTKLKFLIKYNNF